MYQLKNFLDDTTFQTIKNYIHLQKNTDLFIQPCTACIGAYRRYADPLCDVLSTILLPRIEKILGFNLIPTFTFYRIYKNGVELPRHKDRRECEFTLDICISKTNCWPMYININNKIEIVDLEENEALIFEGEKYEHWREPFQGEEQIMLFIHYVRNIPENINVQYDSRTKMGMYRSVTINTNLENYLQVYHNVIPEKDSEKLMTTIYKYNNKFENSTIFQGIEQVYMPNYRKTKMLCLTSLLLKTDPDILEIDKIIYSAMKSAIIKFTSTFPFYNAQYNDTGYQVLRYDKDDFFNRHSDRGNHILDSNRMLSVVYLCNDEFKGGDLIFFDYFKVPLRKNSILIFPSNEMFQHMVTPILEGSRYTIVTWFIR